MIDEAAFQVTFNGVVVERQEVEQIWILQRLLSKVRLRRGERRREVADDLSLPPVEIALELHREDRATPAVFESFSCVPEAVGGVFQFEEKQQVLAPRNLGNRMGPAIGNNDPLK